MIKRDKYLREFLKTHSANLAMPFWQQENFLKTSFATSKLRFCKKHLSLKNPMQFLQKQFLEIPLKLLIANKDKVEKKNVLEKLKVFFEKFFGLGLF